MINFTIKRYFPFQVLLIAVLFTIGGVLIGPENIWLALGLLAFGLALLTAAYKVSINSEKKTYREYLFIAGFKIGKSKKYDKVEDIYIVNPLIAQTVNSRVSTRTFHKVMFRGYVKFDDKPKVLIGESQFAKRVLKKLKKASEVLGCEISDYTE